MKKKLLLSFLFIIGFWGFVIANPVDSTIAKVVAKNLYWERSEHTPDFKYANINPKLVYTRQENGVNIYYVFNFNDNKGFVIVSADDDVYPVLGYSFERTYTQENQPPAFIDWMNNYKEQILYVKTNNLQADNNIANEWTKLQTFNQNPPKAKGFYLLSTTWSQGQYYNASCPVDAGDPSGHAVVGCVATAMGQVMKYQEHPSGGTGSHSYTDIPYGNLSADFGHTLYNWSNMPNSLSSTNNDVATLLYHCGVSVNMNYNISANGGSSASTSNVVNALKNYFGYSTSAQYKEKNNYSDPDWNNLLKNELDSYRPMVYKGQGDGGHAFVCDGYEGTNHFHFNWGWSGSNDDYFYLSNLNPGSCNFTDSQAAIIGIQPTGIISLYSNMTVTPNPIVQNQPVDVSVDLKNYESFDFNGDIAAFLFDSNDQFVDFIEIKTNITLPGVSSNSYTFHSNSITAAPGDYKIYIMNLQFVIAREEQYSNPIDITIVPAPSSGDIRLYSDITVTPNPIMQNQAFDVYVDIANYDATDFTGDFSTELYSSTGQYIGYLDVFSGVTLDALTPYTFPFSSSGINVDPGNYQLAIEYKPSGGGYWSAVPEDIYTNPIGIQIEATPDQYEYNNSEASAYLFTPSYSNNTATIITSNAHLHNTSDIDYYKINLASGYYYIISSRVNDSFDSGDGNTYTCDVEYSYKNISWSGPFDTQTSSFTVDNGGTVYFKVEPYYSGYDLGTYTLDLSIMRTIITEINSNETFLNFKVYPNPTKGLVYIEFENINKDKLMVEITNITGEIIYSKQIEDNKNKTVVKIDMSNNSQGIYFVKVYNNDIVRVKKFILY